MPRRNGHVPAYRLHKPSGQARVIVNGEHVYLGKYGSAESREKYARIIAEHTSGSNGSGPTPIGMANGSPVSVDEAILAYWRFAESYYVKNGEPAGELDNVRDALLPLRQLYGRTPADDFGPRKLKAIRQHLIENGLSRGVINSRVSRIKRMFKWVVSEELVPPSVYHGLQAVAGLRYGKTQARETEPIRPVPDLYIAAVLPFVTPHVGAMMKLQRLSGMRSSEMVIMRPSDIDTSGEVWIYEVPDHKTLWRGHRKQVPLGPEAQRIIRPFLQRDPEAYLFSPREAEQWRLDNRPPYHGRKRKTPLYPSELRRREKLKQARRRRKPKRPKGDRYDRKSYQRAIVYGLKKAAKVGVVVPHWHPHQLRHNRGTEVRQKYGIEAAQVSLGHARADVTQVYAERDRELAKRIAKEMG